MKEYETFWEDSTICIECPYCGNRIIVDTANGDVYCACGATFLYTAQLTIKAPPRIRAIQEMEEE
jgi:DNA-directed RNA polymerase subunit RPC12/RpoP